MDNYFKSILVHLYNKFNYLEYCDLYQEVFSEQKSNHAKIQDVINKLIDDKLIKPKNEPANSNASYSLTLLGFEFCRKHKDYFEIK